VGSPKRKNGKGMKNKEKEECGEEERSEKVKTLYQQPDEFRSNPLRSLDARARLTSTF
jgi:hypothetical protein